MKYPRRVAAGILGLVFSTACGAKGLALGSDGSEVMGGAADEEGQVDASEQDEPQQMAREVVPSTTPDAAPSSNEQASDMPMSMVPPTTADPEPTPGTAEDMAAPLPSMDPESAPRTPSMTMPSEGTDEGSPTPSMPLPTPMSDAPSDHASPTPSQVMPGTPPEPESPTPSASVSQGMPTPSVVVPSMPSTMGPATSVSSGTAPLTMLYCGDGIVSTGEECDTGNEDGDEYCSAECELIEADAGVPTDAGSD